MTPERICVAESNTVAALLEDWARSVRDYDINGVLPHHDPDLLAFNVVGPTSFNGLARAGTREKSSSSHGMAAPVA